MKQTNDNHRRKANEHLRKAAEQIRRIDRPAGLERLSDVRMHGLTVAADGVLIGLRRHCPLRTAAGSSGPITSSRVTPALVLRASAVQVCPG